jgi:HAD superfamily hydrolase (TIGR01509 family)
VWDGQALEPRRGFVAFLSYLFDYNGVLVDDESVHLAAFCDVLRPRGISLTEEEYTAKYLGYDDVGAFRAILHDHGRAADEVTIRELVQAKKPEYFRRALLELKAFPGAGELLRSLAATGAVVGIVSGALRDEIELGLRVLDAASAVGFIVSAEDTRACKPDPEGYLIGRRKLVSLAGKDAEQRALVIEDSLAGVAAALSAGLPCLGVAQSYSESELLQAGATGVVGKLRDITPSVLTELAQRFYANAS